MVYLSEPITTKEVEEGGDLDIKGVRYGVSAMQGWRRNMEDSHMAITELDTGVSIFGVFDGHGGRGVPRFSAGRLPQLLRETTEYQSGDYVRALEKAFLRVDERLREASGRQAVEDLDKPDPGAPTQPVVVPRRVLSRFLGIQGPSREEPEPPPAVSSSNGEKEAGETEATEEPEAEDEPQQALQPPKRLQEAEDEASVAADTTGGEGLTEEAEISEANVSEDDGDDEELEEEEEEEMALVDPSRLTRDSTPEAQGCTAVAVLLLRSEAGGKPRIFCANAGDSRAVLSRAGRAVELSEDHKPENPEETARIVKAGGYVQQMPGGARVQGDLNLSRSLGDLRYKKPDDAPPEEQILTAFPEVRTFDLTDEDEFLVIGCDGIWERVGNQEIVDLVRERLATADSNQALSTICGDICDRCLCPSMDAGTNADFDGTGCDNMTLMVVQLRRTLCDATIAESQAARAPEQPTNQDVEVEDGETATKRRRTDEAEGADAS